MENRVMSIVDSDNNNCGYKVKGQRAKKDGRVKKCCNWVPPPSEQRWTTKPNNDRRNDGATRRLKHN